MKYVQLGILAALILVAGLLAMNLMQDRKAGLDPAPIPAVASERVSDAAAETPTSPPASTEGMTASTEAMPASTEGMTASTEAMPVVAEATAAGKANSAPLSPTPTAGAPTAGAPASRSAASAPASAGKPSVSAKPSPATKPLPSAPKSAPTVVATNPANAPVTTPPPIVVDPPTSTSEAWSTPKPPEPGQDSQNRYELMRPERADPTPKPSAASASSAAVEPPRTVVLPAGTILTVRTTRMISSESATVDDSFTGTLDQPLVHEDLVIAERGSKVEGRVVQVVDSGRVKGTASLAVQLTRINTSDGQTVPVQTQTFTMNAEKSTKGDVAKVGIATGIGAALGAIFGGGRGAAIGAGVGAGAGAGTVLGSKGKPAEIPSETRLNFRLDAPLTLTEKINP